MLNYFYGFSTAFLFLFKFVLLSAPSQSQLLKSIRAAFLFMSAELTIVVCLLICFLFVVLTLLFLLFDLEVVLILFLPFSLFSNLFVVVLFVVVLFVVVLFVGLMYE